jgi:hypothetical protein
MTGWQQLWFGYAVSGLDGHDQEQVIACSPGLLDDPAVERQLRRLCRYDVDDSPAAKRFGAAQSFGWVDDDDLRFVFCRTPVPGSDGSTSVAAHVLVGPRSAAGAEEILELFDSPTWWRGELLDPAVRAAGGRLPTITFEEFKLPASGGGAPLTRVHEDVLAGLAEAVLSGAGSRPVVLPASDRQAVATMCALAREVPSLADLVSFSSHELGPPQQWFDVAACASAGARTGVVTIERALAQQGGPQLGAERLQDAETMVSSVLPFVVGRHGELDRARRDLFFRAIDALVRRNAAGIAWLVNDPRSLQLLVRSRTGRSVAAESLWESVRPRWVLGNQALDLWPEELRELGSLTWRMRPDGVGQEAITDAWTELSGLGAPAADGFVAAFMSEALTQELVGVEPPGRLLAAVLRSGLDARLGSVVMDRLVRLAARHMDPDLLTSPIVPVGWRVRLAVTALQAGTLDRETLAAASARDSQLAEQLLGEGIDDDAVGAVLGAVPPERAAALVAAAIHTLGSVRALRSLREVGRALGSARALTVLEALRSVVDLELEEDDQLWAAGHFARAVAAGVHDARRPDPVDELPWDLAKDLDSPATTAWRQTGYLVRPRGGESWRTLLEDFELLLAGVPTDRDRHALAMIALDKCLTTAHTVEQVGEIVDLVGVRQGLTSAELASILLTRAERMARVPGRNGTGPLLVHLGRTFVSRSRLHRRVELPDGQQLRAEALVQRLTEHQWRDVLKHAEGHGSTCAQWLRTMAPQPA